MSIKSNLNSKQFYVKDEDGYIIYLHQAVDQALTNFKEDTLTLNGNRVQRCKVGVDCEHKNKERYLPVNFRIDFIKSGAALIELDQLLDCERELFHDLGYDNEFLGIVEIQLIIEPTKPSIGQKKLNGNRIHKDKVGVECEYKNGEKNLPINL